MLETSQTHTMRFPNRRSLAKAITIVENQLNGYADLLEQLNLSSSIPVIGFTGPPGAGKSTLISACIDVYTRAGKQVAVLAVDPSSPFNKGAILGDRLRMSEHFLNPSVFIRSMASRGNLGGLSPHIFEVIDVLKSASFDAIFIETVGVGQSEVEIAAIADTTVLVLVPEAGDEIQAMKSGVLEIADVYVVNKSDREAADVFYKHLKALAEMRLHQQETIEVIKTQANQKEGVQALFDAIQRHRSSEAGKEKRIRVLSEQAMSLIRYHRTKDISFTQIEESIKQNHAQHGFNMYRFVRDFLSNYKT